MNRYTGDECAVCKVVFQDGDDVVVCPICGTPHHRVCYNKETGCAHNDWHGVKTYEEEKIKKRRETAQKCENNSPQKCSKCGAQNPPDGLFCQVCGTSLFKPNNASENNRGFSFTPPPINPNPFTTPFGGLSPDEEIDGVSLKELSVFVGDNSFYFIPKMKEHRTQDKVVSWNWSAFFFHSYYFFYRKMYLLGALILSLSLITSVLSLICAFATMGYSDPSLIPQNILTVTTISNICSMLFFGVRILCGFFANYLYTRKTFKEINKIREKSSTFDKNNPDYVNELAAKGRTSNKALLTCGIIELSIAVIIYYVFIFLSM